MKSVRRENKLLHEQNEETRIATVHVYNVSLYM